MTHFVVSAEQIRALEQHISEADVRARASYEEICQRKHLTQSSQPGTLPSFAFVDVTGNDVRETIRLARLHDLTIIARDSRNVITEPDRAGKVMLSCGRPVMVPPRKAAKGFGERIVIAWKNTAESARAVAAATPFLASAKSVTIVAISEGEADLERVAAPAKELAQALKWYGISAEAKALPFSLKPAGETLLDEAYRLDADLLVMGGYGHSRLREFAFGGMTQEILFECEIPVLMSH
jgi:nucleotide-binding universal stress UspA family protein